MKRQTLLQLSIFLAMFLVIFGVTRVIRFQAARAMDPEHQVTVALGRCSLRIPKGFGPGRTYTDQAWTVEEFRGGGLGTLRLATEPADGTAWESLCTRWFAMPAYPVGPIRFQAGDDHWFFKEVPLFGRGAYALRKRGKQVCFIALFEQEGVRHWIGLDARNAAGPQKDLFDGMLRSLKLPDGTPPGTGLEAALRPVLQESDYRLIQPLEVILLIPAVAAGLIFILQFAIRRRAGRLPERSILSPTGPAIFAEGGLELGLARPFQRKLMDCAVTVTTEGLTVLTFGTPFLSLSRTAWRREIEVGTAWLGLPFVKLELTEAPTFLKWARLYRGMKTPLTLRIYTRDAERLRALL